LKHSNENNSSAKQRLKFETCFCMEIACNDKQNGSSILKFVTETSWYGYTYPIVLSWRTVLLFLVQTHSFHPDFKYNSLVLTNNLLFDQHLHVFYLYFMYSLILRLTRRFQILRRPLGSTPLVGSSRMIALESPAKARATHRRRCMPPDRVDTIACCMCHKSTSRNKLQEKATAWTTMSSDTVRKQTHQSQQSVVAMWLALSGCDIGNAVFILFAFTCLHPS
jgi:hypothetical protein